MVRDAVTFDKLKKLLHDHYKNIRGISEFFAQYFRGELKKAQKNFCSSLAAYSVICYLLQIKDRHNGNIMLMRDGCILHIDFGFLLSNTPGKGIELEQKCPFKLITEYIEILGGIESELFSTFRRLFYKGFNAARKHQDQILILVNMLYSSHGTTLPCF